MERTDIEKKIILTYNSLRPIFDKINARLKIMLRLKSDNDVSQTVKTLKFFKTDKDHIPIFLNLAEKIEEKYSIVKDIKNYMDNFQDIPPNLENKSNELLIIFHNTILLLNKINIFLKENEWTYDAARMYKPSCVFKEDPNDFEQVYDYNNIIM